MAPRASAHPASARGAAGAERPAGDRQLTALDPPDTEFVLAVEAGALETQALRLVESLRRFGGRHAGAAVTVVSPRPSRRPAGPTIRSLLALEATYLEMDLLSVCPAHPGSWKAHAVAARECQPGPEVIVMLDSDTLFLGDVGPLCVDAPATARAPDVKGVTTDGQGDANQPYWSRLCRIAGLELEALPIVRTTVDDQPIRASYNGGFVAARRDLGLFTHSIEMFRRIVEADLRPLAGSGLKLAFAGAGPVGVEGTEWWGSLQGATAAAAASLGVAVAPLHPGVNVPIHLWQRMETKPSPVLHVHYHGLFERPQDRPNPLLDGSIALSDDAAEWLRSPLFAAHGAGDASLA